MSSNPRRSPFARDNRCAVAVSVASAGLVIGLFGSTVNAQFSSGSDASDGAFAPVASMVFDPVAMGLDIDNDNVFHFTTINIPAGVTVTMRAAELNFAPVYWLATGTVQIDGTIDLSGEGGHDNVTTNRRFSMPGPGGFPGAVGKSIDSSSTAGFGPGGGLAGACSGHGAPAGYGTTESSESGPAYGNLFLLPLIGGSGGGGPTNGTPPSGGGGAGGGAILLSSSLSISVSGQILSKGGDRGTFTVEGWRGGGGSGGAIRLLAPSISGSGSLNTAGGVSNCAAGLGRIRVEAFQNTFTGAITGEFRVVTLSPNAIFLPTGPTPSVRVSDVDSFPVADPPTGEFASPDVTIDAAADVTITIETFGIPAGTQVTLYVLPETGPDVVVLTTPLAGAMDPLTGTADVTFPNGFSRFTVRAQWTP
jgi:hypothetical protein